MDLSDPIVLAGLAGIVFIMICVVVVFWDDGEGGIGAERAQAVVSSRRGRDDNSEQSVRKRRALEQLETLRETNNDKRSIMLQKDLATQIERSGMDITPEIFWGGSLILGVVLGGLVYTSGFDASEGTGIPILSNLYLTLIIGLGGAYTLPRAVLNIATKRRNGLMSKQFADAIDMIVRGVKSGLPLHDCMRTIAAETAAPIATEFQHICDDLKMGADLDKSLAKFFKRVPLPEVNFFVIVLSIQSKAGGNLSEALGNLSEVIRSRRLMREKIKALASEALASAGIISCLPFLVGTLVYFTSPEYISLLFTDPQGHVFLLIGTVMMSMGVMVMRRMMAFDI